MRSAMQISICAVAFVLATDCGGLLTTLEPARAAEPQRASVVKARQVDSAISSAVQYLLAHQSSDGAWRSDVYAPFKAGDALTPLVLLALLDAPRNEQSTLAIEKATRYLTSIVRDEATIRADHSLAYPIYTAAGAVIALARQNDPELRQATDAWLKYLCQRQLVDELGWQNGDAFYGGWGYSGELPQKPADGKALSPLAEPNLSATVFALTAIRAAGGPEHVLAMDRASAFVQRCQNFASERAGREAAFDDGGFFFIQFDPVRNKAGVVGVDSAGRERFGSYGSATADGLRALLLCGLPADHPRIAAAGRWLNEQVVSDHHPGSYVPQREAARDSAYFYYCHSLAQAAFLADAEASHWAHAITTGLLARQQADGSWANPAVDLREDDPLVATSLALSSLSIFGPKVVDRP